tara:strand:- start:225 stop:740 length:516 start_codon:yes stop_codon:yes gene_type:complete
MILILVNYNIIYNIIYNIMYIYLLFVLIGILLFLLFNNKNKFSIGVPDHSESSESGEDDRQQNTVPQIADSIATLQDDDSYNSQSLSPYSRTDPLSRGVAAQNMGETALTTAESVVEEEALLGPTQALVCASGVLLAGVVGSAMITAYNRQNNQGQQIPVSDPDVETGGHP